MNLEFAATAKMAAAVFLMAGGVTVADAVSHTEISKWLAAVLGTVLIAFANQTLRKVSKIEEHVEMIDERTRKNSERLGRLEERMRMSGEKNDG